MGDIGTGQAEIFLVLAHGHYRSLLSIPRHRYAYGSRLRAAIAFIYLISCLSWDNNLGLNTSKQSVEQEKLGRGGSSSPRCRYRCVLVLYRFYRLVITGQGFNRAERGRTVWFAFVFTQWMGPSM